MQFSSCATQCHNGTSLPLCIFPIIGENNFKASGDGSELWGAAEVQEDEDTRVEVPLDQV